MVALAKRILSRIPRHKSKATPKTVIQGETRDQQIAIALTVDLRGCSRLAEAEILESLLHQDHTCDGFGVVLVVDRGGELLEEALSWSEEAPFFCSVVAAGNDIPEGIPISLTIDAVDADWYIFPGAHDRLEDGFVAGMAKFINKPLSGRVDVISARLKVASAKAKIRPSWQNFKFGADRVIDLDQTTYVTQVHGGSAALSRRALTAFIQAGGMVNGPHQRVIGEVLLAQSKPYLGIASDAVYIAKASSAEAENEVAMRSTRAHAEAIINSYPYLFTRAGDNGPVPEWLAMMFLYDVSMILRREPRLTTRLAGDEYNAKRGLLAAMQACVAHIEEGWILGLRFPSISTAARYFLVALKEREGKARQYPEGKVRIGRYDPRNDVVLVRYFFSGALPREAFSVGGLAVSPVASKTKAVPFLGQDIYFERLVWISAQSWIQVELNGIRQEIILGAFPKATYQMNRSSIVAELAAGPISRIDNKVSDRSEIVQRGRMRRTARRQRTYEDYDARFHDAWVFMDRVNMAQDNAEHLYRHITNKHPEINRWFVLDRASKDWRRLSREGFKLVAFGSEEHEQLYLRARHVISSHLSPEVVSPIPIHKYPGRRRPWKTTFLQHGVTKDDMSHWLNQRSIDALVTATPDEYRSFTADRTPYEVTSREVVLSGFPRHDTLMRKRAQAIESRNGIDTVLIAPTWRDDLLKPKEHLGALRELVDDFKDTDYAQEWSSLVSDQRMVGELRRRGLRVVFLPHPNMQNAVDQFSLAKGVDVVRYSDGDIQQVLARTRLLVTDYSSLAFEAGFLGAPVVYLQSDRAGVFAGGHTYSAGYYDYESDGFGPVVGSPAACASTVLALAGTRRGQVDVPDTYVRRMNDAFVMRGKCSSEIVYETVVSLDQPIAPRLVGDVEGERNDHSVPMLRSGPLDRSGE